MRSRRALSNSLTERLEQLLAFSVTSSRTANGALPGLNRRIAICWAPGTFARLFPHTQLHPTAITQGLRDRGQLTVGFRLALMSMQIHVDQGDLPQVRLRGEVALQKFIPEIRI